MNKDDKNVQNNADTKKIITCRMCGQLVRGLKQPLYMFLLTKEPVPNEQLSLKEPVPKGQKQERI